MLYKVRNSVILQNGRLNSPINKKPLNNIPRKGNVLDYCVVLERKLIGTPMSRN